MAPCLKKINLLCSRVFVPFEGNADWTIWASLVNEFDKMQTPILRRGFFNALEILLKVAQAGALRY